jgi:hypothetical protein
MPTIDNRVAHRCISRLARIVGAHHERLDGKDHHLVRQIFLEQECRLA